MGVWNTNLYGNDVTCDVRDSYIEFLKQQLSNEEAYRKICNEYSDIIGTEEEPLFWYALADTQWKTGRLTADVKKTALNFLEQNAGSFLWEEDIKKNIKWRENEQKLKDKLNSPMPPEKKFRKSVEFKTNPWNVGDIYAYQFHTEEASERGLYGKYILFQKIGDIEYYKGIIYSVVQVFDSVFDSIPLLEETDKLHILPLVTSPYEDGKPTEEYIPSFEFYLQVAFLYHKKNHYPKDYLTFIGNKSVPYKEYEARLIDSYFLSKNMDDWLSCFYLSWKNYNNTIK